MATWNQQLFINAKQRLLVNNFQRIANFSAVMLGVLVMIMSIWVFSLIEEINEISSIEQKQYEQADVLQKKIAAHQGDQQQIKRFMKKVKEIQQLLPELPAALMPVLSAIEKAQPKLVRIESLDYVGKKREFQIKAVAKNKKAVTQFVRRLEKSNSGTQGVVLKNQTPVDNGSAFTLVITV